MNKIIKYNFRQACDDFAVTRWLEDWDYEKNNCNPEDVSAKSNKKYWFKCHRGLHESTAACLCNITSYLYKADDYHLCKKCNSIGQYIIDEYGEDYLWEIWSDKNTLSPFEIPRRSSKYEIWLSCLNANHPDYNLMTMNFVNSHNCPYCSGKRVCQDNSLGYRYPSVINIWSDLNEKSPFDYTYGSSEAVFWKCENGNHNDYKRRIDNSLLYSFRCPECGRENQYRRRGEEHHNWEGGITPEKKTLRKCQDYNEWRSEVYKKDNYTCQVCLDKSNNKLQAHHIYGFSGYPNLRFNVQNGITCCVQCHDLSYDGSFHRVYGTHNNTPEQFEEYVNNRRKELGIDIPFNIYDYMSSIYDDDMEIDDYGLDISSFNPDYIRVSKETGMCSISIPLKEIKEEYNG